jgi:hypothetical protein
MAEVVSQHFWDESNQFLVGVTRVKLTAASDSLTVPRLSDSTAGASCKQLERSGDPTVTVSNSDAFTVSLVGTIGDEVVIATIHAGNRNQIDEA